MRKTLTVVRHPQVACHCYPCRKSSGNTHSINLIVPKDKLSVSGPLKTWTRTGDSGKKVTNSFCGTCGNLVHVDADAMEGIVIVKYGLVDEAETLDGLAPQQEIYCRNMLKWEKGLPTTEKKEAT